MNVEANLITDGWNLLDRGMHSGAHPSRLPRTQAALLVNATVRGGYPKTRPGWRQVPLRFGSVADQQDFQGGRWQGASTYVTRSGSVMLVASVSGRQWKVAVHRSNNVSEITNPYGRNNAQLYQVWFCQAEDFLIMQDGQSPPLVFDGVNARRLGDGELPTGTIMEYALGRIWQATPGRKSFVAGDLVYSSSGTALYSARDAVLKYTENGFLNEGGAFAVPNNAGQINAIRVLEALDTSLGQGPIQVFTTGGGFSVNAPIDRTIWQDVTYPIQTVSLGGHGALAQNSTVQINGDLWYRAKDGMRSFVLARRDFGGWGNVPMSEEMSRILERDSKHLLGHSSAGVFDNRLLMTADPEFSREHGVSFNSLAVVDFHLLSSLGERLPPAYDGVWTGRRILQLLTTTIKDRARCYAFCLSDDGEIELWELTTDGMHDVEADGSSRRIRWAIESRQVSYDMRGIKRLAGAQVNADEISGAVDFAVSFRSDEAPCWNDWKEWTRCADTGLCSTNEAGCLELTPKRKAFASSVTLPQPPNGDCAGNNRRPAPVGHRHQMRIEITGPCRVLEVALHAYPVAEPVFQGCPTADEECKTTACCGPDNNLKSV
jgi:hypothetical protein